MPRFEPFTGLRYDAARFDLADVTSPPYDVIDPDLAAELRRRHPFNAVCIDLPIDDGARDRYTVARELFGRWRREGILLSDDRPTLYVYAMDPGREVGGETIGVIGALELQTPGEGGILPHENTTPKARSDRLEMLRACRANLSPVWGLSPAAGLTALLTPGGSPSAEWLDDQGVRHRLWPMDDPATVAEISAAVAGAPVVIADGHHRYETSLAYRDEVRASEGAGGPAELVMTYVVELSEEHLTVQPIHRLISGLPAGFDPLPALEERFEIEEHGATSQLDAATPVRMGQRGSLCLFDSERSWMLTPRAGSFRGVRELDTARLDAALASFPDHDLAYQHGVEQVVALVRKGDADWGVLVRPASVRQILDIVEGGERMPPKTTFFHPKPRTGVVFRSLA